jgi:hypothetical protein
MEARESQDLFNQIADVLDFEPELFNQEQWGTQLTLEKFRDSNGVEDDVSHVYRDYGDTGVEIVEGDPASKLSECGTSCCVAGWAVLHEGWHPTVTHYGDGFSETYEARLSREEGNNGYLLNATHKIFELEYGFVADRPGVLNEGWGWDQASEWENGVLVLKDGTRVCRVDILAQTILGLNQEEASVLFDAKQKWEGEDLRLIGKGEDILKLGRDVERFDQYGLSEESLSL